MAGLSGEQSQRLGNLRELCTPDLGLHPPSCSLASQAAQMPTGNRWQMTVNRRRLWSPSKGRLHPTGKRARREHPGAEGSWLAVVSGSLVRGDRCWKMGGIQKRRRDWEITRGRCVLQTACHGTPAPLCPQCPGSVLWRGEAPNIPNGYQKPKQLFGNGQERSMAFSLEQGRDITVSRVSLRPVPAFHPTPTH